jgi:hypothetical protein
MSANKSLVRQRSLKRAVPLKALYRRSRSNIPIPEAVPTRCRLTYATLLGRHVPCLAAVLPPRLAARCPHLDPDFRTATFGDAATRKRQQLLRLAAGDVLVFYAGLSPRPPEDRPRLFAIGLLHVRKVYHLRSRDLGRRDLQQRFGQTAHFLRRMKDEELALVEGELDESRLFGRAVPLGDARNCLLRDLARWGYHGSLLRSVGHWINGSRELQFLETWLHRGPMGLVDRDTRLITIAASTLRVSPESGDLIIAGRHLRESDWIIALSKHATSDVRALGRINQIALGEKGERAWSSLFWFFPDRGPAIRLPFSRHFAVDRIVTDTATIRRLVSWFYRRYRVGLHRTTKVSPVNTFCPFADPADDGSRQVVAKPITMIAPVRHRTPDMARSFLSPSLTLSSIDLPYFSSARAPLGGL